MATGTGEHYGNTLTTASGASSARYYAHITKVVFNESTGVSTVTYNLGLQVTRGDFYGSTFTNYGAWSNSYQVYGAGYYGYHDNLTFTCAHNSSEHFYDGAGYNSASSGYLSSTIDFYWYPTLPTYAVSYNANSGSGAPAAQTKTWGTNLTLSSTVPTRTGYTFGGWNTKADGTGTNYAKGGTYSANAKVTLYAKWTINTYSVKYANGGHGTAPSAQTKTYGTALTLRPSMGTVSNYKFKNWKATDGTTYNGGGSYTANAATTLTAQWYAPYSVTYDANGGTGAPSSQIKVYGDSVNISSTVPTRTNYNFIEWNTNSSGTGTKYTAGQAYSTNTNLALYAIWEVAHSNPTISNLLVQRCLQNGTLADDGKYCKVSATVSVDHSTTGYTDTKLKTVTVQVGSNATESVTVSTTATSANISFVSANQVSLTSAYSVKLTVTDSHNFSSYRTSNLSVAYFTMHFKEGGKGIAIGKKSVTDNLFDVNMNTKVTGTLDTTGKITSQGNVQAQCYLILRANADRYSAIKTIPGDNNASGRSFDAIRFYGAQGNADGDEIVIGNGGQTIVGAGESGVNLHAALAQSPGTEQLYLAADDHLYLFSHCGTIANRTQLLLYNSNAVQLYGRCGADHAAAVGTSSNNGVTATTTIGKLEFQDKNGLWCGALSVEANGSAGLMRTFISARNKKTDGTDATNYFCVDVKKDGTPTYSVSNAANFRSAIAAANQPTQLYNNATGVTGNVTLSQTAANFNYLRIFFYGKSTASGSATKYECVEVYAPNGKIAQLSCTGQGKSGDLGVIFFSKMVTISAKAVSSTSYCSASIDSGGTTCAKNNEIYITRVEGWK